jgi:coenzyme F420 hydrogenase subunit beta
MTRMIADGSVIARPGDDDPGAIALMRKLAQKSRERWPSWAEPVVRLGLPEKKAKKAAPAAAPAPG